MNFFLRVSNRLFNIFSLSYTSVPSTVVTYSYTNPIIQSILKNRTLITIHQMTCTCLFIHRKIILLFWIQKQFMIHSVESCYSMLTNRRNWYQNSTNLQWFWYLTVFYFVADWPIDIFKFLYFPRFNYLGLEGNILFTSSAWQNSFSSNG